ncbi:integrase arm-type DNA-binding domain-containing protein [Devosia rhodophyticola]|uniref:Integrase arm-type DNA-binding domain-containing protein n=1 Tax=Devosia rhodophyticola TaxID=3026423 RepID=A0ABY7YW60_9HYPH|nr:site-specific integrase [Devosia rhodophyticola]WDR05549.1 integrase arm-type DNA-binding domain-containing protein [Devosia rhodophyticola]
MAKGLSVKAIDAIKPTEKRQEIADAACRGLYLVVQPTGVRSWSFRYRSPIDARPRKFTIGSLDTIGLQAARDEADALRLKLRGGIDPSSERRAERSKAQDTSRDVGALLDTFIARHVETKKASTAKLQKQQIEADVRPYWEGRKVETISRADINDLLDRIVDRGATVHANRVFALVRKFLNWCVDRGAIERSPAQGMRRPTDEVTRMRVLSEDEIRWLWAATADCGNFGQCVRLLLLTGQRRMEVGGMRRSELDLASPQPFWTIPAARTKNGREHMVPLVPTAVAELERVPQFAGSDLVFTLDGVTVSSGWSKSKSRLDVAMLAVAQNEALDEGRAPPDAIPTWTLHDLRRTCASGLARLRQSPHVIEALLNHKSGQVSGVAAVYNRYEYQDEKLQALQAWERYLLTLCEGQSANVIPIQRGA